MESKPTQVGGERMLSFLDELILDPVESEADIN